MGVSLWWGLEEVVVVVKLGGRKSSVRRRRWWRSAKRVRKRWVFEDAGGRKEGLGALEG